MQVMTGFRFNIRVLNRLQQQHKTTVDRYLNTCVRSPSSLSIQGIIDTQTLVYK